jgi:ribosomal protein S18 acetylase RimI-like enzyme
MTASDVLALEERAMNAWPALKTVTVGGWSFRLSGGCTKRANSINALTPWSEFADVIREANALYASNGLPAIFRISPLAPPECDATLKDSGYTYLDPSLVMLAPIKSTVQPTCVQISDKPSQDWLEGIADANEIADTLRSTHHNIVRSILMPAAFATACRDGAPIGFGLAVRERGMVGLFDIVISPAARGRGYGRAIMQALMAWGCAGGATLAYLQVRAVNSIALKLYDGLGFLESYRYHYRLPPE